jgi:hypothetical protein
VGGERFGVVRLARVRKVKTGEKHNAETQRTRRFAEKKQSGPIFGGGYSRDNRTVVTEVKDRTHRTSGCGTLVGASVR